MTTVLFHVQYPEHSPWNPPAELPQRLAERFGPRGVRLIVAPAEMSFEDALPEAEVLIGRGIDPVHLARASKLRWIQSHTAGIGGLLFPALVESQVVLTNARGVHAPPIAEHLLAMMLALVRKLHRARDLQREHRWGDRDLDREEPPFAEIDGRTLGVVGLGGIGSELAWRANVLGMRVVGVRRRPVLGATRGVLTVRGVDDLPWLLAQSDFVANCLPHTAKTKRLFDARAFGAMRRGAYFLNVGRGDTVDEAALAAALREGHLAGAGIDVTEREPLPPESELWELPNLLLTPHVSGSTTRFWQRMEALIVDNLGLFLEGKPLRNVVDKKEGY